MKPVKAFFNHLEQYIAVLCLTLMLIVLTYNTISRYLFHVTVSWAEEMCAYGQIWLVYIAVSYAVKENAHICIDSVMGLYPKKLKGIILTAGLIAWFIFGVIMVIEGAKYTMDTFIKGGRAISVPVPIWLVYLAIPVGHVLLSVRLLQQIAIHVKCVIKGIDPTTLLEGPPPEDIGMFNEKTEGGEE